MTQISRYIIDTKVTGSDKWIGSDSETQNTTKNFTPNKLSVYFNENQVIDIGTPIRYRYDILELLDDRLPGTITFFPQVGTPYDFSDITNFILSKYTLKGNDVSEYLDFLVGKKILISNASNTNIFGYYRLDSLIENLLEPNFFDVTLTYLTGNGAIVEDKDYLISLVDAFSGDIPTKTSDLINDGEDGVHPFITLQDVSGFVPYTGATNDINIGTHKITADNGTTNSEMSPSLFGVENNSGNTYGLLEYNQLTMLSPSGSIGITASGITFPNASLQTTAFPPTGGTSLQYIKGDGTLATFPSTSIPTLDQVLTAGNTSLLDAEVNTIGVYDATELAYGYLSINNSDFILSDSLGIGSIISRMGITFSGQIGGSSGTILLSALTASRTYTLPNASGTVALTSNIGTWGALNYPTWTTGTPFVKMTAAGTFALDTNTYLTSAVTSIGMTVPSAFNVTPSTITSSGTFAITGAGAASQYVRGDGTLANFPTSTGGGASVSYYLNGSVSQGTIGGVAYKEMNSVPVIGAGTDFTINANGYIAQFITDVGDPNKLLIPAGNWNFETYFSASSGGGSPRFYIELYKYDGATFTLIATSSATPENITGGTSIDLYFTALAVPSTSLLITDRLAVRFYVIHSGRTITMHTENSHLSQIITTFSSGLTALNGLTSQVQYLAVGTAGTDFNISSVTDTHTFNLPTASATNRGALSNTDWSTFNGKFNLPSLTSGSVLFSNGTTIAQDNAQLFWDDTNNRLGIGTSSPTRGKVEIKQTLDTSSGGLAIVNSLISGSLRLWVDSVGASNIANGTTSNISILSTGNVGIGTTAPTARLHVAAPGALSTDIALRVRNSADSGDLFTIAGDGSGILLRDLTINGISVGIGKNNIASNTILGFQVFPFLTTGNNNTSVGYQSSFNLTTGSLNAALGVAALFGNSTGSNNVGIGFESGRYIADGTTASTIYNTSVFIGASTKSLANSQANQIVIGYNATGLGSNSVVLGNDSIVTTALKGNVGIGTTAPAIKLQVETSVNGSDGIWGRNTNIGASAYGYVVAASGVGAVGLRAHSAAHGAWPNTSMLHSASAFTNGMAIYQAGASPISFWANDVERMRILSNGNVGIGTATPLVKLHVVGTGESEVRVSENTNNNYITLYQQALTSYLIAGRTGATSIQPLAIYTGGSEKMRIQADGNVGINTAAPTAKLAIKAGGALSTDIALRVRNSADTTDLFQVQGNGAIVISTGAVFYTLGNNLNFRSNLAGGSGYVLDIASYNNLNSTNLEQGFGMFSGTYAPTSGTGTLNGLKITQTINQTGGANGITRGLFINPTLTAAADFRAIETTVGNVILGSTSGNVGIGTTAPVASAKVQIDSTTQGFLPPRMTNAQRIAIVTPAVGLMVYCTDVVEGLYINKSTGWTFII